MTAPAKKKSSSAARVAAYRKRMRDAGYRQKTVWTLDLRNPEQSARLDRAIEALAASDPAGDEWMTDLYAIEDWPAET
jgi:hypothetical protein